VSSFSEPSLPRGGTSPSCVSIYGLAIINININIIIIIREIERCPINDDEGS
jgi:hypothetical protein